MQLQTIHMGRLDIQMTEKYNGWRNYETWLMALNLNNDESIYDELTRIAKRTPEVLLEDTIKEYVENSFYNEEYSVYKICDTWTQRDFDEIDWEEIANNFKPEEEYE